MTRIAFATLALAFCFAGPAVAQGNTLVYVGSVVSEQENLWEYNPGGRDYVLPSNRSAQYTGTIKFGITPEFATEFSFQCALDETKAITRPHRVDSDSEDSRLPAVSFHVGAQFDLPEVSRWDVQCVGGPFQEWCVRSNFEPSSFAGAVDLRGRGNMAAALKWLSDGDTVITGRTFHLTILFGEGEGGLPPRPPLPHRFSTTARYPAGTTDALYDFARRAKVCADKLDELPNIAEFAP